MNANWICFDCRVCVRRDPYEVQSVACPDCGKACRAVGTKVAIPPQRANRAWSRLLKWLNDQRHESMQVRYLARQRRRHQLERMLAEIAQRPLNRGLKTYQKELQQELNEL